MPLTVTFDATDDLVVFFDESNKTKTFEINLVNKGDTKLSLKKLVIYLPYVKVLNFDGNDVDIEVGTKKTYIFETHFEPTVNPNEGRIRFFFSNRTHLTRTVKTIFKTSLKIFNIADAMKDEEWIKEFHVNHPPALAVTDDINVEFKKPHGHETFEVLIQNNTRDEYILRSVKTSLETVQMCRNYETEDIIIKPKNELNVSFQVDYLPDRWKSFVKIWLDFTPNVSLTRTIKIIYRKRGQMQQKEDYAIPHDLMDLIHSERKISRTQLLESLDDWTCARYSERDYARHFHNLLFLEEIGLSIEMKEKYNKSSAHFGDRFFDKTIENGRCIQISQNYEEGVYDLTVNDLFETRPSLQVGDKIIARKKSQLNVSYEGAIIDIKDDDLIVVKFKYDFVKQFDHTAYSVEFMYSRVPFVRMHFAIDMAIEVFGIDFLMPKHLSMRANPNLDIILDENLELVQNFVKIKWFNKNLNAQQRQAVVNILRGDFLNPYVIYGPPGTGKTTTLSEVVLQILKTIKNSKIVIATQSNSAADLIAERLIETDRFNPDSMLRLISFIYENKSTISEPLRAYTKTLEDLIPDKEFNIFDCLEHVKKYRIVIGTSSSMARLIEKGNLRNYFTHAIIDEAGQCTEMGVLIPMVLVGKEGQTIMAGDPMQMPPLVLNMHAQERGLTVSMLSRLLECYSVLGFSVEENQDTLNESRLVSKLIRNYRALPSVMEYYNKQFYKSELIAIIPAIGSREAKTLEHLAQIFTSVDPEYPTDHGIHFIDVDGRNIKRKNSWCNIAEAQMIKMMVENLLTLGLSEDEIGIITPYALQTRAIASSLKRPEIRIGTVEDFQGLERKVILISTVRTCSSNAALDVSRKLGFVKCPKRINVAMSRARILTIVVGKSILLTSDENWNALIDGCKANKTYTGIDNSSEKDNNEI